MGKSQTIRLIRVFERKEKDRLGALPRIAHAESSESPAAKSLLVYRDRPVHIVALEELADIDPLEITSETWLRDR